MENECEKFQILNENYTKLSEEKAVHLAEVEANQEKRIEEIKQFYGNRMKELAEYTVKLKNDFSKQGKSHDQYLKDVESDTDQELLSMQFQFEKKLKEEKELLATIKAENVSVLSTYARLTKDIEARKSEIQKMIEEEKRLNDTIKTLQQEIVGVKQEVKEKFSTFSSTATIEALLTQPQSTKK